MLFDGRRVYWRMVILVVVALRGQRDSGFTMERLKCRLGVDAKTVRRWQQWYRERLSPRGEWHSLGSRLAQGLQPDKEVECLVTAFIDDGDPEGGMVRLLRYIAAFEHIF